MPQLSGYPVQSKVQTPAVKQTVRLEALGKVGLFRGMSKRSLARIDQVSEVRTVDEGDTIVAQGDTGSDMMVVLSGVAAVRRGKRKVAELATGQSFGEMALLDRQARSASVIAMTPMQLLVIDGGAFRKLLSKVPGLTDSLLATLSQRLRDANAAADL
jgi:CRP-like cAMP-binding protein